MLWGELWCSRDSICSVMTRTGVRWSRGMLCGVLHCHVAEGWGGVVRLGLTCSRDSN